MVGPSKRVSVPLPPDEAVSDFLKVKPTKDMPRPGPRRGKAKTKKAKGA